MELSDEGIMLRPFRLSDAEEHLAGEDDEQVKWLSGGEGNLEGVRDWIRKNEKQWEDNGHIFNFAIVDFETKKLLGMVEANTDFETLEGLQEGDANISYGLYPNSRGKGNAGKAVSLIADFLRNKGFKRAVIRVNPENKKSLKIPLACEFLETSEVITKAGEKLKVFIKVL